MAYEQINTNLAKTTLTAGYTAGAGSLTVASTSAGTVSGYGGSFPTNPTFRVAILDATTGAVKALLKVTAVTDSTHWATAADTGGFDANANSGDIVAAPWVTGAGLTQVFTDTCGVGPFASRPTSTVGARAGMRYRCTDSLYEFIFDGSVWQAFVAGAGVAVSLPPTAGWTVENAGSGGGLTDTTLGIQSLYIKKKGATQIGTMYRTAPATPYTITAVLSVDLSDIVSGGDTGTSAGAGIGFRSASGQWEAFYCGMAWFLNQDKWTSVTSISANRTNYQTSNSPLLFSTNQLKWFRMADDGTTITFSYSVNGVTFTPFNSFLRGNFLSGGPATHGLAVYAEGCGAHAYLLGWTQS